MIFFNIILIVVSVWLMGSALYVFIYAVSGFFYKCKAELPLGVYPKAVVFIPGYKEDSIIYQSALEASLHLYRGEFDVVVIADSFQESTLLRLSYLRVKTIQVSFEVSTKSKALNHALREISNDYEMAVILDADNVMQKGFLNKMASSLVSGASAIQGRRAAKNIDSNFAFLDAISEEVNNHIYSKGPVSLGMSSRLAGSGMAFEFKLFKNVMKTVNAVGGFDKELELKLIDNGISIYYNHSAVVLDEKVNKPEVFKNQRKRWISAQYFYLRQNFYNSMSLLVKGNFDYFYKYLQLALPPRLLLPVLTFVLIVVSYLLGHRSLSVALIVALMMNIVAYSIAIPLKYYQARLITVALSLPKAILMTLIAVLGLNGANTKFIHTPHSN